MYKWYLFKKDLLYYIFFFFFYRLRKELNEVFSGDKIKFFVNDFIIKVSVLVCKKVSEVNFVW